MSLQIATSSSFPQQQVPSPPTIVMNGVRWETFMVEGRYQICDRSLAFPFLPLVEVPGFIEQSRTIGQRSAVRLFPERIREILPHNSDD